MYRHNKKEGAVVVVIIWQLDLQLPVQSVLITTYSCFLHQ